MIKNFFIFMIINIIILSFFITCDDNSTEPKETKGTIEGTVILFIMEGYGQAYRGYYW